MGVIQQQIDRTGTDIVHLTSIGTSRFRKMSLGSELHRKG